MNLYVNNIINKRKILESKEKNFDNIIKKYPDKVLWGGSPSKYLNIKKSNKLFN